PDFREQLHLLDEVVPVVASPGLDGIFLTHAHMGHYTGLMFLGFESIGADAVPVYAMPKMASYLESNGPWDQLVRYHNIALRRLSDRIAVSLNGRLTVTPFLVPHRQEYSEVAGFRIEGPRRSVVFIPDINGWEEWDDWGTRVEEVIAATDVAYLDGSFFAHGEIPGRDMSGFPHPLISDSMRRFSTLPAEEKGKIRFIHLNHTNPVLRPGSDARREVETAGFHIAEELERMPL
ncbi:MAG: MBL fold metallo-hydrolase, partial [Acidobacteriota bacterium]